MSSYSSYRPRSASRGNTYGNQPTSRPTATPALPPDRDIQEGLQDTAIKTLSKPQISPSTGNHIKPEDVKYIGSYNWVEESQPTIIVPGSPPEWRERPFPYRVRFDTDVRFVDQNSFRMGTASCLLPLIRAVDVFSEDNADTSIDWSAVDIVTDRNGLRKLMRWLQHSSSIDDEPLKEFRIDLQLGGSKTVLMHRWEKRTREVPVPPRSGCGINFERESTMPAKGCERSTGYHRIVQYDLGGLNLIVRFEVDACIPKPASSRSTTRTASQPSSPKSTSANVDSLTDMLAGLNVASKSSTTPPVSGSADIAVIHGGSEVPQSSIIELTTRSVKYVDEFDWAEAYPQLLLSATPHLFLAVHDRGTFQGIKKHELGTPELRNVENRASTQRVFRQLVDALRAIQDLVKEHGQRGRLSLVCQGGALSVFERTNEQGLLPDSDLERFV